MIFQKPYSTCNKQQTSDKMKVKQKQYTDEDHSSFPGKITADIPKVKHIICSDKKCHAEYNKKNADTYPGMMFPVPEPGIFPVVIVIIISVSHNWEYLLWIKCNFKMNNE